jgi:ABC-type transport system involved in multi-copper enzyme maturation permease subunit
MLHLWRIAINSFREALREPVYFLMLFGALLLIGHYPWMTLFVFREQLKLVVDGAMATTMLFSLAVCVLCATSTVSREMRNGTVLLLLSKPISRWSFVLGKIFGIVAASLLFCWICSFASVVSVYIAVDQFRADMTLYLCFIGLTFLACVAGMAANYLKGSSFSEYSVYAAVVLIGGILLSVKLDLLRRGAPEEPAAASEQQTVDS